MQPGADGGASANRPRSASEDAEDRLERILRILFVLKQAAADAENQPAMPPHQGSKGRLLMPSRKALEQDFVDQLVGFRNAC
jgi:hypothetical protein